MPVCFKRGSFVDSGAAWWRLSSRRSDLRDTAASELEQTSSNVDTEGRGEQMSSARSSVYRTFNNPQQQDSCHFSILIISNLHLLQAADGRRVDVRQFAKFEHRKLFILFKTTLCKSECRLIHFEPRLSTVWIHKN